MSHQGSVGCERSWSPDGCSSAGEGDKLAVSGGSPQEGQLGIMTAGLVLFSEAGRSGVDTIATTNTQAYSAQSRANNPHTQARG